MRNRIALLFAATAVLASCMKENSLAPEQTNDNLVTIKAVAAETKTLLGDDGTSVVWEENDAISVVVEGESDKYLETFTTSSTEKTSIAEFTAALSNELSADETVTGIGYAVYPATSVTLASNMVSIVHELPEEQTGTITSGMNLSYAKVDADDIKAGETNAVFYNALTLLKVNVPAGVKSVVLTSSALSPALVGKVNFTVNKTSDDISFVKGSAVSTKRSVTLSNGGAELKEGVHDLLVFPGTAEELTLTMTGTDGAVYESTLSAVELVAGTYRTINLTKIFKMGVEDEMFISPAGGECEVKIASVADYTYDVAVTPTAGGNWLSYTLPTKGFHQDVITFSAEENTTGADRTANVTITWGEGQTRTFEMTQNTYEPALINDYLESYIYGSTYTGNLSVELSDDYSKGTYKVTGFLNYSTYSGQFSYTFYANYANNVLTLIAPAASNGNFGSISSDVELNVSDDFKKMTMVDRTIGYASVSGYQAVIALGAPELNAKEEAIVGVYDEVYTSQNTYGDPAENSLEGSMIISASDEASYGRLKVTFLGYKYKSWDGTETIQNMTAYADLSDEGKMLTIYASGATAHQNYGMLDADVVLTVSDGLLSCDEIKTSSGYWTISKYTSTKQVVGGDSGSATGVGGVYDATWVCLGGNSKDASSFGTITEVVTITKKDGSENEYSVTNMFTAPTMGVTSTNYDATYENGTLTVHLTTGDIELSVSDNKLIYSIDEDATYPKVHDWNLYTNCYEAIKR